MKVSPEYVMKGLIDRGMRPVEAAGIVGNIWQESKFDTGAVEDNPQTESARRQGGGFGLYQVTDAGRKRSLLNMAKMQGKQLDDPELQLDHLVYEFNQPEYKKAARALQKAQDPRQAAYVVSKYFLRPSAKHANNGVRMSIAEKALNMFNPIGEAQANEQPIIEQSSPMQPVGQQIEPSQSVQQPEINDDDFDKWLSAQQQEQPQQQPEINDADFDKWLATQKQEEPRLGQQIAQGITDIGGGVISGTAKIGSNLIGIPESIKSAITGTENKSKKERDQSINEYVKGTGANPEALGFKAGEMIPELAATSGVGGAMAKGMAKLAPGATGFIEALRTGGVSGGNIADKIAAGVGTGLVGTGILDSDKASTGGVIGGAIPVLGKSGDVAGEAAVKLGNYVAPKVSKEIRLLAKKAADYGIDLPVDKIVNSKPLNAIAKTLEYIPFSGREGTQDKVYKQFNKALSKTIGEDTDNIVLALDNASEKLGSQFNDFLQNNQVKLSKKLVSKLDDIKKQASDELTSEYPIIEKQINKIINKAENGIIDGQAAYNIKKTLDRIGKRNTNEAYYANKVKYALLDGLNDTVGAEKSEAFKKLRAQYGNMLTLDKLVNENSVEGGLSVGRLANKQGIHSSDLKDLAKIANHFLKERESQHGAMQRAVVGGAVAGTSGIPGLVLGAAGGQGTNRLLNSKTLREKVLSEAPKQIKNSAFKDALLSGTAKSVPVIATNK